MAGELAAAAAPDKQREEQFGQQQVENGTILPGSQQSSIPARAAAS